ncbi:ATP-dependent DNA helicase RecQ [Candidatus Kaiserbacteria bacterium]|nr:ATP-dependent DNA helicase RecQ [Candidatus Kaiserbacteria bacterium]
MVILAEGNHRLPAHLFQTLHTLIAPGGQIRLSPQVQGAQAHVIFGRTVNPAQREEDWRQMLKMSAPRVKTLASAWLNHLLAGGSSYSQLYNGEQDVFHAALIEHASRAIPQLQLVLMDILREGALPGDLRIALVGEAAGIMAVAVLDFLSALRDVCDLYDLPGPVTSLQLQCWLPNGQSQSANQTFVSAYLRELGESPASAAAGDSPLDPAGVSIEWNAGGPPRGLRANFAIVYPGLEACGGLDDIERLIQDELQQACVVLIQPGGKSMAGELMCWRRDFVNRASGFSVIGPCGSEFGKQLPAACQNCQPVRRESFHPTQLHAAFHESLNRVFAEQAPGDKLPLDPLDWSYTLLHGEAVPGSAPAFELLNLDDGQLLAAPVALRYIGAYDQAGNPAEYHPDDFSAKPGSAKEYLGLCPAYGNVERIAIVREAGNQIAPLRFGQVFHVEHVVVGKLRSNRYVLKFTQRTRVLEETHAPPAREFLASYGPSVRRAIDRLGYRLFGFPAMRDFQHEILAQALAGRHILGIAATGGGKSECFILPAMLLGGVTVVVSPLKSLMQDQFEQRLRDRYGLGYLSTFINGDVKFHERQARLKRMELGHYKLIYMTPEQLERNYVLETLRRTNERVGVRYIALDEAHCISQWGHDFRPSYLNLVRRLRARAVEPVRIALTATASPNVRKDLCEELELINAPPPRGNVLVVSSNRPELNLIVRVCGTMDEKVDSIMDELRRFRDAQETSPEPGAAILFMPTTGGSPAYRNRYFSFPPEKKNQAGAEPPAPLKLSDSFVERKKLAGRAPPHPHQGRLSAGVTRFASHLERALHHRISIYHGQIESDNGDDAAELDDSESDAGEGGDHWFEAYDAGGRLLGCYDLDSDETTDAGFRPVGAGNFLAEMIMDALRQAPGPRTSARGVIKDRRSRIVGFIEFDKDRFRACDAAGQVLGAYNLGTGVTTDAHEDKIDTLTLSDLLIKPYGDLTGRTRSGEQNAFIAGERSIMVATKGFGMGIDKPNIRLVIHRTPTANLEAYAQEAGRAGRDGQLADVILYYSPDSVEAPDSAPSGRSKISSDREIQEFFLNEKYIRREDVIVMRAFLKTVARRIGQNLYFTNDEAMAFFERCTSGAALAGLPEPYEWPQFPPWESEAKFYDEHRAIRERGEAYNNRTRYIQRILAALYRIRPEVPGMGQHVAFLEASQQVDARLRNVTRLDARGILSSNYYFGAILRERGISENELENLIRQEEDNLIPFADRLSCSLVDAVGLLRDVWFSEGGFNQKRQWEGALLNASFITPKYVSFPNADSLSVWRGYAGAWKRAKPKTRAPARPGLDDWFPWPTLNRPVGWEVQPGPAFFADDQFEIYLAEFMRLHDERERNDWDSFYRLLTDYVGVNVDEAGSQDTTQRRRSCLRSTLLGYLKTYEVVSGGNCHSCNVCVPDERFDSHSVEERKRVIVRMSEATETLLNTIEQISDVSPPEDHIASLLAQVRIEEAAGRSMSNYVLAWSSRLLQDTPGHRGALWVRLEGAAHGLFNAGAREISGNARQILEKADTAEGQRLKNVLGRIETEVAEISGAEFSILKGDVHNRLGEHQEAREVWERLLGQRLDENTEFQIRARLAHLYAPGGPLADSAAFAPQAEAAGWLAKDWQQSLDFFRSRFRASRKRWRDVGGILEAGRKYSTWQENRGYLIWGWLSESPDAGGGAEAVRWLVNEAPDLFAKMPIIQVGALISSVGVDPLLDSPQNSRRVVQQIQQDSKSESSFELLLLGIVAAHRGVTTAEPEKLLDDVRRIISAAKSDREQELLEKLLADLDQEPLGKYPDFLVLKAEVAERRQDFKAAISLYERAAAMFDSSPARFQVYSHLAQLVAADGPYPDHAKQLESAGQAGRLSQDLPTAIAFFSQIGLKMDAKSVAATLERPDEFATDAARAGFLLAWIRSLPEHAALERVIGDYLLRNAPWLWASLSLDETRLMLGRIPPATLADDPALFRRLVESIRAAHASPETDRLLGRVLLETARHGLQLFDQEAAGIGRLYSNDPQSVDRAEAMSPVVYDAELAARLLPHFKPASVKSLIAWLNSFPPQLMTSKGPATALGFLARAQQFVVLNQIDIAQTSLKQALHEIRDVLFADPTASAQAHQHWESLIAASPSEKVAYYDLCLARQYKPAQVIEEALFDLIQRQSTAVQLQEVVGLVRGTAALLRLPGVWEILGLCDSIRSLVLNYPQLLHERPKARDLYGLQEVFKPHSAPRRAAMMAAVLHELRKGFSPGWLTPVGLHIEALVLAGYYHDAEMHAKAGRRGDLTIGLSRTPVDQFIAMARQSGKPERQPGRLDDIFKHIAWMLTYGRFPMD